jgi:acid phosphatase family membrane protein YuiD
MTYDENMASSMVVLFSNPSIWAACIAWTIAQFTKMLCGFYRTHRLDFSYLVSTGGMPSAHSALATGLATSLGITIGFDSAIFALGLAFALITMFDASTVRRAAGLQARLLNEIIDELFKEHHFSERKLAELLGHTRIEVLMGAIIGILAAMLVVSFPYLTAR